MLNDLNVDQARFIALLAKAARAERDAMLGHGPDSNLSPKEATPTRGERNPSAVLSNVQAQQVRIARMRGEPLALIAKRFGVRESTVSRIVNGRRRAR